MLNRHRAQDPRQPTRSSNPRSKRDPILARKNPEHSGAQTPLPWNPRRADATAAPRSQTPSEEERLSRKRLVGPARRGQATRHSLHTQRAELAKRPCNPQRYASVARRKWIQSRKPEEDGHGNKSTHLFDHGGGDGGDGGHRAALLGGGQVRPRPRLDRGDPDHLPRAGMGGKGPALHRHAGQRDAAAHLARHGQRPRAWCEGPVWMGDWGSLIWSDIPNHRTLRWIEDDGHVSVFQTESGYSNGHTRDNQ